MASFISGIDSTALSVCPPSLLHRGSMWLASKAPNWGHAPARGSSISPCRRLPSAVSVPSPGNSNSKPAATSTAVSVVTERSIVGSLPWKVQWQLPSAMEIEVSQPKFANGGDTSEPGSQSQLSWTPFDRGESICNAAQEASGWDPGLFNARLADLMAILPDLSRVLPSLTPSQLVTAMSDTHAIAAKVVLLKAALPSTNVGMMLLLHPPFMNPAYGPERLLAGIEHASRVLGGSVVAEEVIQWYPPLMDPAILDASVAQLRRLVPQLARNCLPSARQPNPGTDGGGGDARQLVHLLGIVMQRDGSGLKGAEDGAGSVWWGCS